MQGRYGYDELSRFLLVASLLLMLISCFPSLRPDGMGMVS